MKIGIDIRDLHIAKTGAKTYLAELVNALQNHPDKNFQYVLLDSKFKVFNSEYRILKIIEHIRFFLWKQMLLPVKAKIKGCEILICTDYFVPVFNLGIKTIPVFHDAFFYEYPEHYNKYWLFLFEKFAINAARKSQIIVTPTRYAKEQIVKFSDLDPSKILVIYEAGKTLNYKSESAHNFFPKELKDNPYLLHIGTMEKRKNIPILIKAFKTLNSDFPNLKLVLAGQFSSKSSMNDKQLILKTIKELNLSDKVVFTGYLADEELNTYYRNALLYVFPSLNEGFGLPILESFSNGLAVVASDNTCLPEIGGDAVLYFNPYDEKDIAKKVKELVINEKLRNEFILKGKHRVQLFTWFNTADAFVKQFYNVCKK